MLDQLANTIKETPKDCAVIVLKSGGNHYFCAGASFDELSQIKTQEEATLLLVVLQKYSKYQVILK